MSEAATDPRLAAILDAICRIARQDFTARAPVSEELDTIDAIATGLNMLAEELGAEVASRRDLEEAYGAAQDAQAQLIHAGKLAAIGQLASGVAHEINNPAMSIEVVLELVSRGCRAVHRQVGADAIDRGILAQAVEDIGVAVGDAREAISRIRDVTGDLRTFARTDDDVMSPVSLDEIVEVSCRLAGPVLRTRAELELELGEVPSVVGNRGRLGQVVTNLVVNAAQSIPENAAARVVRVSSSVDGDDVVLAVEDTGPGVPAHLRSRVFEPFYTTKPEGVGTGLGLPLVSQIVDAHGGRLRVTDSSLGGARFEARFPRSDEASQPALVVPMDEASKTNVRVLLVDDEAIIVRLMEALIGPMCELSTAHDGADAIELIEKGERFELILCDLHMPKTDGIEVYRAVERICPDQLPRFVFTTGGATTQRGRDFLAAAKPRLLAKPFPASELIELIEASREPL